LEFQGDLKPANWNISHKVKANFWGRKVLPVRVIKTTFKSFCVDSSSLILTVSTSTIFVVIVLDNPVDLRSSTLLLCKNTSHMLGRLNIMDIPSEGTETVNDCVNNDWENQNNYKVLIFLTHSQPRDKDSNDTHNQKNFRDRQAHQLKNNPTVVALLHKEIVVEVSLFLLPIDSDDCWSVHSSILPSSNGRPLSWVDFLSLTVLDAIKPVALIDVAIPHLKHTVAISLSVLPLALVGGSVSPGAGTLPVSLALLIAFSLVLSLVDTELHRRQHQPVSNHRHHSWGHGSLGLHWLLHLWLLHLSLGHLLLHLGLLHLTLKHLLLAHIDHLSVLLRLNLVSHLL
jgi:hypothetical protein